ncbi:sensor histidine kinase [Rhodoplanes roseus]|uniref:sensor histidine kinase n=1 Tax=Rhodoplanes roseus TaxID=29409 RepID=UPI0014729409|nr:HWE histidine kinase domain-containing protein [Rhodoplanes roseus]
MISALLVCTGFLIRWGLGLLHPDIPPYITAFPVVFLAGAIGGVGPGILAGAGSGLLIWWAILPFGELNPGQQIGLGMYALSSAVLIAAAHYYRRLMKRLEDEQRFRELVVRELSHRLKNKVATIGAIIAFQLRDTPLIREEILGRLQALAGADDLIASTQGSGAALSDIVALELGPYFPVSRASVEGPEIRFPAKLALAMALMVHELVTNAAKYGALSVPTGRIAIRWTLNQAGLVIDWTEQDGPPVRAPTRKGFGMRLLANSLEQFDGTVSIDFSEAGLRCRIALPDPSSPAAARWLDPSTEAAPKTSFSA